MKEEALHLLALTRTKGIGVAYSKNLIQRFGDAKAVFQASPAALLKSGLPVESAHAIHTFTDWASAEAELLYLEKIGARPLFFTDSEYPQRLLPLDDAPLLLFYKGDADLNTKKIISVVGTRNPTEHGKQITEQIIRQLAQPDLLIVSGLAHGVDARAHSAALKYNIPTIGILGHGLNYIYPRENRGLAKEMLRQQGGLLTRFCTDTSPDSFQFPLRNRLIAGMCDAVIVVETRLKGGSMLTIGNAEAYGKKIFAVPGRFDDACSSGCNWLIQQGKAGLFLSGQHLQESMGWETPAPHSGKQASLSFPTETTSLSVAEKALLNLLTEGKTLSLDEICIKSQLEFSTVAKHLLSLELQGLICSLPGKRYRLS
ncbi:DNA-processing protein DprA [Puia sp. P3]|uniref:DNA-processing protein DprA n=1 Tax=Puia sp. P3 TaxID=3423952 RepID=UPI003D66F970